MTVPTRPRLLLFMSAVALGLTAACGSGDDTAASTSASDATTTIASTATTGSTTTSEATTEPTTGSTTSTERATTSESTSGEDGNVTELTVDQLELSLQYPEAWVPDADHGEWAFIGNDGFLVLTIISASGGLDAVAETEAGHVLEPYGSGPTIEVHTVDGREARLIVPSDDAPAVVEGFRQSAVLVPTTSPDSYIAVFSDPTHIESIVSTFRWQT